MTLFRNIKKIEIFSILLIVLLLSGGTYFYNNYYLKLLRFYYLFQASFAKSTITCSQNSPEFMYDLMVYTINNQKSMNNQLVFQPNANEMYHCESGWENGFNTKKKITENSRFRYASVTKVVTSAIILDLINQGKLHLDDKLVDIIDVSEPKDQRIKKITVAMLLEHSAGFDRFKKNEPMLLMGVKPYCPTDIKQLTGIQLDFEPNTQFQYSNLGYCLLGMIVEKKTGKTFRDAVEEKYRVKEKNIKFVDNDFLADEIQYDYRFENFYSDFYRNRFDFKGSLSAVGGLSGSAKGMVLIMREMLNDRPYNILLRSQQPCAIYLIDGCYGYALLPYQERGSNFTVYGKEGYFPGVETDVFVDDKNGILAIFRGATAPEYNDLIELRRRIYTNLKKYYKIENGY